VYKYIYLYMFSFSFKFNFRVYVDGLMASKTCYLPSQFVTHRSRLVSSSTLDLVRHLKKFYWSPTFRENPRADTPNKAGPRRRNSNFDHVIRNSIYDQLLATHTAKPITADGKPTVENRIVNKLSVTFSFLELGTNMYKSLRSTSRPSTYSITN